MATERMVVSIDVGTTKVCTLIAEVTEEQQLEVIGVGVCPSRGLRKGIVINPDEAMEAIRTSVRRAEQQSGFGVVSAYVGISGAHLSSTTSHGVVAVRRHDAVITEDDVARALEAAQVVSIPPDRELVHVMPRHFVIDGQEGIKNAVDMLGHRLEVHTLVVSGAVTSIHNLTRCVDRANVEVEALIAQPLAAGEAVLTEAERELGVVLIDLGGGTTDIAVFAEGSLAHLSVLAIGGNHISNDIAVGLRTPFAAAEEIKVRHGCAMAGMVEDERTIDVAAFEHGEGRPVSRRALSEIIEARLVETLELVREQLKKAGVDGTMPAGTVLVGGTAQVQGIRRLASEILESPVRVGAPSGVYGLVDAIGGPAFACSVGLLKSGSAQVERPTAARRMAAAHGPLTAVGTWLRSFLP